MSALLWFAIWGVVIFLMMRFGCGAHVLGHGHEGASGGPDGGKLRWVPPETDVDPVCGKTVKTADGKPSVFDGHVYYFCSRDCREVFEAAPGLYVGDGRKGEAEQLEGSHA